MAEKWFEYKIRQILNEDGFLVIKCARSKPFDLIAIKRGVTYLIEIKGKNTRYPKEQYERQVKLAHKAEANMAIIRKAPARGVITILFPVQYDVILPLKKALLKEYAVIEEEASE